MRYTVSANRLTDGTVIYSTEDSQWTTKIENALILDAKESAEKLLEQAHHQHQVIGPYIIMMDESDTSTPKLYREQMRTKGPSVRTDLGIQAGNIPSDNK